MTRLSHLARLAPAPLALALLLAVGPTTAVAHGPDPLFGTGTWAANQVVHYSWSSGAVPPAWMTAAIDAGAGDVAESRASRAASFVRVAGAPSTIAYGVMPCVSYAIACVDRSGVPKSFAGMWLRAEGWAFDWGTLHWCQAGSTSTDGCFDVENIALDELGHVEILGHHVNYADNSDYTDAVVQAVSRQKPAAGWNRHAFGACDVARLQLEYERQSPSDAVSTCLSLATTTTLAATPASAASGQSVTFTTTLRIALDSSTNRALSGDPLSRRTVLLQRRVPGTTVWSTVATMTASASLEGSYTATWTASATYEWRATFATPAVEGVTGSSSSVVKVNVASCTTRCPARVGPPTARLDTAGGG